MRQPIPFLICLLLSLPAWLPAQEFAAFVDRKQVTVGETFQVSFRLNNVQGKTPKFPDFAGFNVRGGPGLSQSTTIVNGQVSQSVTYSFYLQAVTAGSFTIGEATVEAGGQTLRSEPVAITVSDRGSTPPPGNSGSADRTDTNEASVEAQLRDNIFVRTLVDKTEVYQGEQITVTYKFYKRVQTMNLTAEDPPRYEGFWVENVDLPRVTSQQEVYQGKQYQTAVIKQDILFPQRSGELNLDPMTLSCVVQVRTEPANPRNPFERFFNTYQEYNYSFKSPAVRLKVKPLPGGQPADFSGMVGDFDLQTSLDRTETETGEPVTLKVTLSGQGNIKKLPPLTLDFPDDFEVFDPQVSEQASRQNGRLGGRRSYEYLIVPRNPGDYRLPEIRFSYFDVRKGRYETLTGPEYVLNVTGQPQLAPAPLPGNLSQDDVELIGQDIRFIHPEDTGLRRRGTAFGGSLGFWGLLLLPLLVFGGLWTWRQRQRAAATDVAGTRSRKATALARKRLLEARTYADQGADTPFFRAISQALWNYLGDKFNVGQAGYQREAMNARLHELAVDPALIDRLNALLDTCEMALYAPAAAPGGREGTYDEALDLIVTLEKGLTSKIPA